MVDYSDFQGPSGGADNMGGTKQFFYYAPLSYFNVIAKPDPAATTLAGKVEIASTHTFITDKGFHKMYCTLDKGSAENDVQGERDGRSYKQMLKAFYPGSDSEIHGFVSQAKNDRFIILVPMPDGKINQIGSEDFYAEITAKFTTGTNSGGIRGYEITGESMGPSNLVYKGTITLATAEFGS